MTLATFFKALESFSSCSLIFSLAKKKRRREKQEKTKQKREKGKNKTNNNKKPTFTAPVEQYILKHMKKVLQLAINDPRTKLYHF